MTLRDEEDGGPKKFGNHCSRLTLEYCIKSRLLPHSRPLQFIIHKIAPPIDGAKPMYLKKRREIFQE
jgi:hypothetical protein